MNEKLKKISDFVKDCEWMTFEPHPFEVIGRTIEKQNGCHIDRINDYHAYCVICQYHMYTRSDDNDVNSYHVAHINRDQHVAFTSILDESKSIIQTVAPGYNSCRPCGGIILKPVRIKKTLNLEKLIEEHCSSPKHVYFVKVFKSDVLSQFVALSLSEDFQTCLEDDMCLLCQTNIIPNVPDPHLQSQVHITNLKQYLRKKHNLQNYDLKSALKMLETIFSNNSSLFPDLKHKKPVFVTCWSCNKSYKYVPSERHVCHQEAAVGQTINIPGSSQGSNAYECAKSNLERRMASTRLIDSEPSSSQDNYSPKFETQRSTTYSQVALSPNINSQASKSSETLKSPNAMKDKTSKTSTKIAFAPESRPTGLTDSQPIPSTSSKPYISLKPCVKKTAADSKPILSLYTNSNKRTPSNPQLLLPSTSSKTYVNPKETSASSKPILNTKKETTPTRLTDPKPSMSSNFTTSSKVSAKMTSAASKSILSTKTNTQTGLSNGEPSTSSNTKISSKPTNQKPIPSTSSNINVSSIISAKKTSAVSKTILSPKTNAQIESRLTNCKPSTSSNNKTSTTSSKPTNQKPIPSTSKKDPSGILFNSLSRNVNNKQKEDFVPKRGCSQESIIEKFKADLIEELSENYVRKTKAIIDSAINDLSKDIKVSLENSLKTTDTGCNSKSFFKVATTESDRISKSESLLQSLMQNMDLNKKSLVHNNTPPVPKLMGLNIPKVSKVKEKVLQGNAEEGPTNRKKERKSGRRSRKNQTEVPIEYDFARLALPDAHKDIKVFECETCSVVGQIEDLESHIVYSPSHSNVKVMRRYVGRVCPYCEIYVLSHMRHNHFNTVNHIEQKRYCSEEGPSLAQVESLARINTLRIEGITEPLKKSESIYKFFKLYGPLSIFSVNTDHVIVEFMKKSSELKLKDAKNVTFEGRPITVSVVQPQDGFHYYMNDKMVDLLSNTETLADYCTKLAEDALRFLDNKEEDIKVGKLLATLEDVVGAKALKMKCHIFGSRANGLTLPSIQAPDVDVFIGTHETFLGLRNQRDSEQRNLAYRIFEKVKRSDLFSDIGVLPNARIPIVLCCLKESSLKCDVSFKNGLSVQNTNLVKFMLSLDERPRPMILLLKEWIDKNGLHKIITNYAVSLLVLHYLASLDNPVLPAIIQLREGVSDYHIADWKCSFSTTFMWKSGNDSSVVQLLQGFFKYYHQFDYNAYIICPLLAQNVARRHIVRSRLRGIHYFLLSVNRPWYKKIKNVKKGRHGKERDHVMEQLQTLAACESTGLFFSDLKGQIAIFQKMASL